MKSLLGNFYRDLAIFSGPTDEKEVASAIVSRYTWARARMKSKQIIIPTFTKTFFVPMQMCDPAHLAS